MGKKGLSNELWSDFLATIKMAFFMFLQKTSNPFKKREKKK
jgi:hypothetical protein